MYVVNNTGLVGQYYHSLSTDVAILEMCKFPIIGKHILVTFIV